MTVSSSTARVAYSGNGATTAFAVPYYFLDNSHLAVILQAADGTETTQTISTHYTVTGAGVEAGGTVTMLTAPASGTTLVIQRSVPATQTSDIPPNDRLPASTLERGLDKLTMLVQQMAGGFGLARVLKLFAGDTDGSGRYDANGNQIVDMADGEDATDAATLGQVEALIAQVQSTGIVPRDFEGTGDGSTILFVLGPSADWSLSNPVYFAVYVDGLRQTPTDWTIYTNTPNKVIEFVVAPPLNSKIYVAMGSLG